MFVAARPDEKIRGKSGGLTNGISSGFIFRVNVKISRITNAHGPPLGSMSRTLLNYQRGLVIHP